ncbi:MAG: citrate lyase acyl carrier protein [Tissierellia bacterium]|nr:citrate lyase acyl carrier protein [Tissierellia bacterium]MDD4725167.1 citrate lyase acyl carrier protein [Tissierellia bacterium]
MAVINKMAKAGSVESNDILVMMSPGDGGIDLEIESIVYNQYGDDIKKTILDTLKEENITDVKVIINDKGALDFTIRARVKACIRRGSVQDV